MDTRPQTALLLAGGNCANRAIEAIAETRERARCERSSQQKIHGEIAGSLVGKVTRIKARVFA